MVYLEHELLRTKICKPGYQRSGFLFLGLNLENEMELVVMAGMLSCFLLGHISKTGHLVGAWRCVEMRVLCNFADSTL